MTKLPYGDTKGGLHSHWFEGWLDALHGRGRIYRWSSWPHQRAAYDRGFNAAERAASA